MQAGMQPLLPWRGHRWSPSAIALPVLLVRSGEVADPIVNLIVNRRLTIRVTAFICV